MLLIISGTNKKNSNTRTIADNYFRMVSAKTDKVKLLCLEDIQFDFLNPQMYSQHSDTIENIQQNYFNPSDKFVFLIPEYNGSIPGILKLLIDSLEVKEAFRNKKAAIIGISTGRAGNLRGLDHLSSVMQHMLVTVMPNLLPISRVKDLLDENGQITNDDTLNILQKHIEKILEF